MKREEEEVKWSSGTRLNEKERGTRNKRGAVV
jgi:hypothetical protein